MTPDPSNNDLIAEVERLQREVDALRDELVISERRATLGAMAGAIAHEFNNILTPVRTYAEMALATPEDATLAQKALQKASHGASKAATIARSLLGFACGDDGPPVCEVLPAVEESMTCLTRDPAKDGVAVRIDIEPDLIVAMSEAALEQVLINLTLNAIEAMRETRGGELEITAERSTWNTNTHRDTHKPTAVDVEPICIRIRDTGAGIPERIRRELFQPFTSGRVSTLAGRGGAGLGLAICRRLVDAANGTIEAHSSDGVGTTFQILLPSGSRCDLPGNASRNAAESSDLGATAPV